jgi:hypothetical protein
MRRFFCRGSGGGIVSKSYPLEIENVGEDDYIVMSRGHHNPHVFMKAVRAEGYDWPLGMPSHRWVKQAPTREGFAYHFVNEGTRGAFPATYAHEAYGDNRYEAICVATMQVNP